MLLLLLLLIFGNSYDFSVGLFLRLLLIMGITWLLDIFSYIENQLHPGVTNPLYYISDFMNAMTGLLIFICFVLKPKVLKLMKRRYVFDYNTKMSTSSVCFIYLWYLNKIFFLLFLISPCIFGLLFFFFFEISYFY